MQLFEERDKREKELKQRLVGILYLFINSTHLKTCNVCSLQLEMEERRQSDQVDYWLVQYQRLLDSKPQSLVDQVYLIFRIWRNFIKSNTLTQYINATQKKLNKILNGQP